jgi:hypothetical protein
MRLQSDAQSRAPLKRSVMCNNATASFREQLEFLKRESDEYFCTEFESAEAETKENIRIKSGLFDLINKAQRAKTIQFPQK